MRLSVLTKRWEVVGGAPAHLLGCRDFFEIKVI